MPLPPASPSVGAYLGLGARALAPLPPVSCRSLREAGSQFLFGVVEARADGSFGDTEDLRCFDGGELLDLAEDDDAAMVERELCERGLEAAAELAPLALRIGRRRRFGRSREVEPLEPAAASRCRAD